MFPVNTCEYKIFHFDPEIPVFLDAFDEWEGTQTGGTVSLEDGGLKASL